MRSEYSTLSAGAPGELLPQAGDQISSIQSEMIAASKPNGPTIKVVPYWHTPKHSPAAAQAVQDCDVIAIESVGFSSERQRAKYETAATALISPTATAYQRRKAGWYLGCFTSKPLASLLSELDGSGKRIVTIDVNKNTPEYSVALKSIMLEQLAIKSIHRVPNHRTRALLHDAAECCGRSSASREATDVSQLKDLVAQYEDQAVKIGVLVGLLHTPVNHEMSRLYPTEHRYISSRYTGQTKRELVYFPPLLQMARQHRFVPNAVIPQTLVDRAILHGTRIAATRRGVAISKSDTSRQLEELTDTEVSELTLALDGIKSGILAKLRPKRTLARMDALVSAKLADTANKRHPNE